MPVPWISLNPLTWLEEAVSAVLVAAHDLLTSLGPDPTSGAVWVGAIALLVVAVRVALLPLVLQQVRAAHRVAAVAPQLRALHRRYHRPSTGTAGGPSSGPRLTRDPAELQRMRHEQRALYREAGASPLSFLPVLLQLPVMLALARVLDGGARGHAVGLLSPLLAAQAGAATLAGAPLSSSLLTGGSGSAVGAALVVVVGVASWLTLRAQLTRGSDPAALEGPAGQAQHAVLWLLPLVTAATGAAVPLGLLVYWACSGLWSLGQQLALLRWLPTPGSPAAAARDLRR